MRDELRERRRVNIATAANLIGFCSFPVGWSWTEVKIKSPVRALKSFAQAEAFGRKLLVSKDNTTREGMRAFRQGAKFRRASVERALLQLILVQSIPAWLTNEHSETNEIADTIRLFYDLKLDAERSLIGLHALSQPPVWYVETDGLRLVDELGEKLAWGSNASRNDWLLIERLARERIESIGMPETQEALARQVLDDLIGLQRGFEEPNRSELMQLLARLTAEYGESEK